MVPGLISGMLAGKEIHLSWTGILNSSDCQGEGWTSARLHK